MQLLRMRSAGLVVGLAMALVLAGVPPAAAMQTGSFLKKPAHSLGDFLTQVRGSSVLQKRYGRHLGIPWQSVPAFLAKNLRPERLRQRGHYTVYNVTADGHIYPTKQRLPANAPIYRLGARPVFFTSLGDPARPFFTPTAGREDPIALSPPPKPAPVEEIHLVHVPSE